MSKELDEELKSYVEQMKPDLWNRIEQQLPAKNISRNVTSVLVEEENNKNEEYAVVSKKTKDEEQKIVPFPVKLAKKYGAIAAACVVIAIVLPIAISHKDNVGNSLNAGIVNHSTASTQEDKIDSSLKGETTVTTYRVQADIKHIYDGYATLQSIGDDYAEVFGTSEFTCQITDSLMIEEGKGYFCVIQKDTDDTYVLLSVSPIE